MMLGEDLLQVPRRHSHFPVAATQSQEVPRCRVFHNPMRQQGKLDYDSVPR